MSEKILQTLIFALTVVVAVVMILNSLANYWQEKIRVDEKEAVSEAIDGCSRNATATWQAENGAKVTEPYRPVYEECMKEKGY